MRQQYSIIKWYLIFDSKTIDQKTSALLKYTKLYIIGNGNIAGTLDSRLNLNKNMPN